MITLSIKKNFRSSFIIKFIFLLLAIFLFIFPKGGFKISSIPITWGYLLIGFITILLSIRNLIIIQKNHLLILALLMPFQVISLLNIIINGFENVGFTISFLINFFFLPLVFFLILSEYMKNIPLDFFLKIIRRGTYFLACYGIVLFFFKIFTGKFFGIPMLTTNFSDSLSMEGKCIARGDFFKLISTYNNGNIFGICMLMILPIYQYTEKKISKKLIVKLALLLTLSRTVWLGLIINEILDTLFLSDNRLIKNIKLLCFFLGFGTLTIFIAKKINLSSSFFLDLSLGNRIKQFSAITESGLFGNNPFKSITEITYMSILNNFGYLGLFTYCLAIFSPFIIRLKKGFLSPISYVISLGLMNYLIISFSDGATLFIPTLALFWFFAAVMTVNFEKCNSLGKPISQKIILT